MSVCNLSGIISHSAHSRRPEILHLTKLLILHLAFCFAHSCLRTPAGAPDTPGWFTVLTYWFGLPLMSPLFSVCVCWKPPVRAYCCPGLHRRFLLRALQLFCRSPGYRCVYGAGAPPAGLKRKMRPVCCFKKKKSRLNVSFCWKVLERNQANINWPWDTITHSFVV